MEFLTLLRGGTFGVYAYSIMMKDKLILNCGFPGSKQSYLVRIDTVKAFYID